MAKTDGQSGRTSTRLPPSGGARASALAEDDVFEAASGGDAFYRPVAKRAPSNLPSPGDFPFREKGTAEGEPDAPFLRANRRVAIRRGGFPRGLWGRIGMAAGTLAVLGGMVWLGVAIRRFAAHDPRFRIDSSENIQILGNAQVTQPELLGVFGGDMGRNVFFIPLRERQADLERLPWVETATVMRLLPDQLRVAVVERTPVAFVRNGSENGLVDRTGVLLAMDPKTIATKHYSFPVVTGIMAEDPLSTRAARMRIYLRFVSELDGGGEKLTNQLSEVDLSDPEDVRAMVPSGGSELLLHLGDQDFLARWRNYRQHLAEWKAQYPRLASVDLRYERQVVLEMQKGNSIQRDQAAAGQKTDDSKVVAAGSSPAAARQTAAAGRKRAVRKGTSPQKFTSKTQQHRY